MPILTKLEKGSSKAIRGKAGFLKAQLEEISNDDPTVAIELYSKCDGPPQILLPTSLHRAQLLMKTHKYPEAIKEYEKALELRRNFIKRGQCRQINCLIGLADAQLSAGRKMEAMRTYREIYARIDEPAEGSIFFEVENDDRYKLAQFQVFVMVL